MAATSAIPAAIDALVSLATAALPSVVVVDGPGATDNVHPDWLFVGVDDPDSESAVTAAEGESAWAALGHRQREETFTVNLAAVSWSGDNGMKAVRDAAFTTVAAVEQAIVDDPTLGGAVLYASFAGVSTVRQNTTDMGTDVHALFVVRCKARLI